MTRPGARAEGVAGATVEHGLVGAQRGDSGRLPYPRLALSDRSFSCGQGGRRLAVIIEISRLAWAGVERHWGCRRVGRIPGIVGADGSWCVPGRVRCWWAAAPCR